MIPARGGSKGIKDKNLQKVGGESLLARAVRTSLSTPKLGEVWVSSDSLNILEASKSLGAKVHRRDPMAAADNSLAKDVVSDFINAMALTSETVIVYLQPTSPFRSVGSIEEALKLFSRPPRTPVVGVKRVNQHPAKMLKIGNDGLTSDIQIFDSSPTANRQQLDQFWYPNGALYIFSVKDFLQRGDIPVFECLPFEMSEYESMDVDTPFDLELCEKVSVSFDA